jgi:hypothetical protein
MNTETNTKGGKKDQIEEVVSSFLKERKKRVKKM